jgi:hypothetical protein
MPLGSSIVSLIGRGALLGRPMHAVKAGFFRLAPPAQDHEIDAGMGVQVRLDRTLKPLRHPNAPGPSLTGVRLLIAEHASGLPVLRAFSLCTWRCYSKQNAVK